MRKVPQAAQSEPELEGIPRPGDLVAGKYRIERLLGVGGMGCVVAATHLGLAQPVAVKFMLARFARIARHVMRFEREAKAAARLKSDHVAKVLDVGLLPSGTPFMVMELLEGEDLAARLRRGPLPIAEAVDVFLEASEALAEAHRAGIVHRDVKPGNLFLARQSDGGTRVKVLDFGISKMTEGPDLTKTSTLMGSPLYMAPEQMLSAKSADARSDIWALGCILFECLAGRPPFLADTLPEICSLILTHPPAALRSIAAHVPVELEAAVERALVKRPEGRYRDLGEMAAALAPFASPGAAAAAQRMLAPAPPVEPPPAMALAMTSTAAPVANTLSPPAVPARHVVACALVAALALVTIGLAGVGRRAERAVAASLPAVALPSAAPERSAAPSARTAAPGSASASASARAPRTPPPSRRLPVVKPGDSLFDTP